MKETIKDLIENQGFSQYVYRSGLENVFQKALMLSFDSNLYEEDGMALTKTIGLGMIALLVVIFGQLIFLLLGVHTASWLEIAISGLGVLLFVGAAVVDFYILPRTYRDEQYLPAALSMYLTYINLFIFILRLLIAINSRD